MKNYFLFFLRKFMNQYEIYGYVICIPWFIFCFVILTPVSIFLHLIIEKNLSFYLTYICTVIGFFISLPLIIPALASLIILSEALQRFVLGETNFLGRPRRDSRIFLRKFVGPNTKGDVNGK